MSSSNFNSNSMKPEIGDTMLSLPVTFDYSGGRKESSKTKIAWTVALGVIGFIVGIGIITSKKGNIISNIILDVFWFTMISFIIRFLMLKEGKVRENYIKTIDSDYKYDTRRIWGIFDIENEYPYYCRFRNGMSGLFVRLNKDVILGKYSESENEHYEAISDALNLAGAGKVRICHIDYMDNVGTDERLEESFISLGNVENEDLKELLTDAYSFLQRQMTQRVTTFDVYLFMWSGSDINAWSYIQRILSCFLEANYRSYHILNSSELRDFKKTLGNLHDFSVIDAMSNAFNVSEYNCIIPISKICSNGSEIKYNKTMKEKKEEQAQKIKEQEIRKQELKNSKKYKKGRKTKNSKNDDEIDLF